MTGFWLQLALSALHLSHGPHGIVAWVQPPHIAAGIGIVRWHVVSWLQVTR